MNVDAAEMEADAIHTQFKKLTSEERNWLTKEGKCFYCKKPRHIVHSCPSCPKQRFPPRSQLNFRPKHHIMHSIEEEKRDEEDNKEGKNKVTHIQQMIMGLSMEEIDEVQAFSDSKNF